MATHEDLQKEVERILRENNAKLAEFMKGNLARIAGNLHTVGLIEQVTVERMRTKGAYDYELAAELLAACRPSLVEYPEEKFPIFIATLKKGVTMVKLVEEMEDDYKKASMSWYISTFPERLSA